MGKTPKKIWSLCCECGHIIYEEPKGILCKDGCVYCGQEEYNDLNNTRKLLLTIQKMIRGDIELLEIED